MKGGLALLFSYQLSVWKVKLPCFSLEFLGTTGYMGSV